MIKLNLARVVKNMFDILHGLLSFDLARRSIELHVLDRLDFELVYDLGIFTACLACLTGHISALRCLLFVTLNYAHALLVETTEAKA